MPKEETIVGVISDTHGLLRKEAVAVLKTCDSIIHAGDIGSEEILTELKSIAPVTAVRGNIDTEPWAERLPEIEIVEADGVSLYVLHNVKRLDLSPESSGFAAVISGHSHKPSVETRSGVLYLNPGSAGPRRFKLPITMARMKVSNKKVSAEIVELTIESQLSSFKGAEHRR